MTDNVEGDAEMIVETVDDVPNPSPSPILTPTAEEDAMEIAREKAEARRKRILEKANKRMNYVNGEQVQDEEEKKSSISNAARIRAARQRRYGKKTASATATSTPKMTTTTTTTTTTENSCDAKDATDTEQIESTKKEAPVENSAEIDTSEDIPKKEDSDDETIPFDEPVVEKKMEENKNTDEPSKNDAEIAPVQVEKKMEENKNIDEPSKNDAEITQVQVEKKKKYLGVARMRRKMLAKKKMENTEEKPDDSAADVTASTTTEDLTKTSADVSNKSGKMMGRSSIDIQKIPIYMHIFIIVLLFATGVDVGIQQFHPDVYVPSQVAIREYGVPFVHRNPWQSPTLETDKKRSLEDELQQRTEGEGKLSSDPQDEFTETEEEYVPNIDPLFRVDLDEMTKGPGLLNTMAKGAISIHRIVLWLLYYGPIGIVTNIISIPSALLRTPPSLFISAIILRQVVGKVILVAEIPAALGEGGDNDGAKQGNNIEVLSLAKKFIKNFIATTFPTLFTLYDAYVHLKSDMYIMLCGVLFGLAWTHLNINTSDSSPTIMSEDGTGNDGADEL